MPVRIRRTTRPTYRSGIGAAIAAPGLSQPPPAAPPTPTPPPDPYLIAQQAQAQNSLAVGDIWDQYSRGQIENEYGYGADVSNPFSRAQLQKQAYERNQRGATNSYASQGQLYAGSYQNAQDYNARQYAIADDASRRQYRAALDSLTRGQFDRYSSLTTGLTQDQLAAIRRALELG